MVADVSCSPLTRNSQQRRRHHHHPHRSRQLGRLPGHHLTRSARVGIHVRALHHMSHLATSTWRTSASVRLVAGTRRSSHQHCRLSLRILSHVLCRHPSGIPGDCCQLQLEPGHVPRCYGLCGDLLCALREKGLPRSCGGLSADVHLNLDCAAMASYNL